MSSLVQCGSAARGNVDHAAAGVTVVPTGGSSNQRCDHHNPNGSQ
jgi:hypothetical protein